MVEYFRETALHTTDQPAENYHHRHNVVSAALESTFLVSCFDGFVTAIRLSSEDGELGQPLSFNERREVVSKSSTEETSAHPLECRCSKARSNEGEVLLQGSVSKRARS
jgi:hypothetical protein